MLIRTGLVLALLTSLSVAPAGAAPGEPAQPGRALSTPELLERAVVRGRLNRATADVYLARALGAHRKLPDRFVSDVPWDGTLPLLRLQERVKRMQRGVARAAIREALNPVSCSGEPAGPDVHESVYFHIHYDDPLPSGPGLTITDYGVSLDAAWSTEVLGFGWAQPPLAPSFTKYPVVVADLGTGLYGFVAATTLVGDNPATPWNDVDAFASCMALNEDYSGFPSPPQASLDATTAHELNHSIQFGYGALTGPNAADDVFVEGGATWMEDEVFDDANDNYFYLWPDFTESMGEYPDSPYPYWVVFRALTERYGTGTAGAGEQVMQDFWEETSKSLTSNQFPALSSGVGTNLPDAFHAAAIAIRLGQGCGGAWAYPHCLEENPGYAAVGGPFPNQGAITSAGGSSSGSIRDDYSINWVSLPTSGPYPVTLRNTSTGGALRATVACVTAVGPALAPLPAVVGAAQSTVLVSFDPSACTEGPVAVITNQAESAANPFVSVSRSYQLIAGLLIPTPKTVKLKAKPSTVDPGDRTTLRAKVLPCAGHEGDVIQFFRGKKKVATKQSNGSCVAKVKVKVPRTSVFRAVSPQQDDDHLKGTSKKVKVRVRQA